MGQPNKNLPFLFSVLYFALKYKWGWDQRWVPAWLESRHMQAKGQGYKYTETRRANRELAEEVSFTETRSCVVPGAGGARDR